MTPSKPRTVSVKLVGGPLAGRLMDIPASDDSITIGPGPKPFWTYTYAGKEAHQVLFAKQPTQRKLRRYVLWHVGKFGRDPRVPQA